MSKITGILYPPDIMGRKNIEKTTPQGDAFQNTLDKKLDDQNTLQADETATHSLSEIRTETLNPVTRRIQSADEAVVQKTDALLNRLDQYSADLNNPAKNLKEIAPLINAIKTDAQELMNEAQHSLTPDNELHDIAKQCAVMANVEYIKFERGDYL